MPANLQHINIEALQRIEQIGGGDLVIQMCDLFNEHVVTQIKILNKAFENSDRTEIEKGAHSIRSSALNIGAEKLASISEKLEKSSHKEEIPVLKEDLDTIKRLYFDAERHLELIMKERYSETDSTD